MKITISADGARTVRDDVESAMRQSRSKQFDGWFAAIDDAWAQVKAGELSLTEFAGIVADAARSYGGRGRQQEKGSMP